MYSFISKTTACDEKGHVGISRPAAVSIVLGIARLVYKTPRRSLTEDGALWNSFPDAIWSGIGSKRLVNIM